MNWPFLAMALSRFGNAEGSMVTLDVLGEEVQERERAELFTKQYVGLFDTIQQHNLDSNVSVKPTMLGMKIDHVLPGDGVQRRFRHDPARRRVTVDHAIGARA